ncbi:cupin domain-containing protein [Acetobacteraceae bacterium]|nr:cupin domain-containing protein [Acetobacteraceae bacterium]
MPKSQNEIHTSRSSEKDNDVKIFNLLALSKQFPKSASSMMMDMYLKNSPESSIRLFRLYKEVKPHHHNECDEILYIISGEGNIWIESPENSQSFSPGMLVTFPRGVKHAIQPDLGKEPVIFFSIDTPRREKKDIVFENPKDGTSDDFMGHL